MGARQSACRPARQLSGGSDSVRRSREATAAGMPICSSAVAEGSAKMSSAHPPLSAWRMHGDGEPAPGRSAARSAQRGSTDSGAGCTRRHPPLDLTVFTRRTAWAPAEQRAAVHHHQLKAFCPRSRSCGCATCALGRRSIATGLPVLEPAAILTASPAINASSCPSHRSAAARRSVAASRSAQGLNRRLQQQRRRHGPAPAVPAARRLQPPQGAALRRHASASAQRRPTASRCAARQCVQQQQQCQQQWRWR